MKEFHRNYVYRPTELEKKGRRVKNHQKEVCECFVPFLKLHRYDCPAVRKPCPVHGNFRHHGVKDEKGQPEQNMIISFHPSSKTERLFQPVKTLLAQCNPDTKINLQYYSPKSTTSQESVNHQQPQTKIDDRKRPLNNNVFVEKTKSFVADKTNKMKKLKQCFHSPCNSIIQKSRSQTSIKEKFHDMFPEDKKKNGFCNMASDKPPDDFKYDPNLIWFNKLDFKNWEKLSAGKTDSDFITVTQQAKNNLINHKIFEIKHKKGLNDFPFVRASKESSQLIYSSLDFERSFKKTRDYSDVQEKKPLFKRENSPPSEGSQENDRKQKADEELSSSENSQTSSNSSVYFTPFIFVPATADGVGGDGKMKVDEAIQVGSKDEDGKIARETQTPSFQGEKELVSFALDQNKTRSVLQQTDLDRKSGDSATTEWYLRQMDVAESFTTRGTQTDESLFRLHKSVGDSNPLSELSSFEGSALASRNEMGDYCNRGTQTSGSPTDLAASKCCSGPTTRTVGVQMSSRHQEGVIISTTRWTMCMVDKVVQTNSRRLLDVRRMWSLKVNKSQMAAPKLSNKTTQTIFSRSESLEEVSEFIDMDSSNVTFVVKPFNNQESDQAIDKLAKAWWGKSHSDSELYGTRRCGCLKPEYVFHLPQGCICKESETTRESATPAKNYQKNAVSYLSNIDKDPGNNKKLPKTETADYKKAKDKALGTDNGAQRSYKRADKGLGTDSWMPIPPEMSGTADKALETDFKLQKVYARADKALGTDSGVRATPGTSGRVDGIPEETADRSPRKAKYASKAEQTYLNEEDPQTSLSDLSELTKIIQQFFEKTSMKSSKSCACETPVVSGKKTDRTGTADSRRPRKEYVDGAVNTHTNYERKVDSEGMTDYPKKSKREVANAEIQATAPVKEGSMTDHLRNFPDSDRIKIRRSVLLDDNQTKTRFICSVCSREIKKFSTNAGTNTENPQSSPRKKEKTTSISADINEVAKIKTLRTVQSLDAPKKSTGTPGKSAGVQYSDANEGTSSTFKPLPDYPQSTYKSYAPFPRAGTGVNANEWTSREVQTPQLVKPDSVKRTATTTLQNPSGPRGYICDDIVRGCTNDTCPNREVDPNAPSTSRTTSQKTDHLPVPKSDHMGGPNSQPRTNKSPADRSRTQRRTLEPHYYIFIESHWPREFIWNMYEKSDNSIPEDRKDEKSQQKGSYEKEMEPAGYYTDKRVKGELEKPSRQYLMLGIPTPSELRMEDRRRFLNKHGYIWVPSFSTSNVFPFNKHSFDQSKTVKSEEKAWDANRRHFVTPPEGLDGGDSPDLFTAKSCRLIPMAFGCDNRQSFEKLFERRVCKSLTFVKADKEDMCPCSHGVFECRPQTPEDQRPTGRHISVDEDCESSIQDLEKLLEECSRFYDKSESPSTGELLPEGVEEATEEGRASMQETDEAFSALDGILFDREY